MGKRGSGDREHNTRFLYRKSNHTLLQSTTCSGTSVFNTKSAILQLKKKLSQTHYFYEKDEKIKREISVETDICILRRYFKNKTNRLSVPSSPKSRYSTIVNSEIGTIEEFQDTSACGDSENTERTNNLQLDITKIMMSNLQDLLNDWIQKYLFENEVTKNKLETAFSSIMRKEIQITNASSSRSTYVLNRGGRSQEVKNKKVETTSLICSCHRRTYENKSPCKTIRNESSCGSASIPGKYYRVISTLSIPRNLHKRREDQDGKMVLKKTKSMNRKHLILSINKSNFDLLTISTKSFTKRCATYDAEGKRKKYRKNQQTVFDPKPSFKRVNQSGSFDTHEKSSKKANNRKIKNRHLKTIPSLVKIFYADQANMKNTDSIMNCCYNDNFTRTENHCALEQSQTLKTTPEDKIIMQSNPELRTKSNLNEEDQSDPMVNIDFMNESLEFSKQARHGVSEFTQKCPTAKPKDNIENKLAHCTQNNKRRRHKSRNKVSKQNKFHNKRFTFQCQTSKQHKAESKQFLDYCQNILQCFADCEGDRNIKVDIDIKVVPTCQTKQEDKFTITSKQNLNNSNIGISTILCNVEPNLFNVKDMQDNKTSFDNNTYIIPLLDGAASQAKYIFKSETTTFIPNETKVIKECGTITDDHIMKDINEIKDIIKDMTKTAEAFVKEQIKKQTQKKLMQQKQTQWANNNTSCNLATITRGVQCSNEFVKQPIQCGLKLSKIPKNTSEFYDRLIKKSNSYNIIESESILRVTDMTSAAYDINQSGKSLPQTKSLNEITDNQYMAYYCGQNKNPDFYGQISSGSNRYFRSSSLSPKRWWSKQMNKNESEFSPAYESMIKSPEDLQCYKSCNSVDSSSYVEENILSTEYVGLKQRKGMGFGEGFVFCLLLWIPVILLSYIFYIYVLKDALYLKDPAIGRRSENYIALTESNSGFNVKVSDLGF